MFLCSAFLRLDEVFALQVLSSTVLTVTYSQYCAIKDLYNCNQKTSFYFQHCSVKEYAYEFTFVAVWTRYAFLLFDFIHI